ncbi:hypothetical protein [Roseibium sp. Sym1]|uniref:hypothetical protein n=1 Tax=Roseibium sp. Sym1 TaxID=3016006 RepID=UPI0022B3B0E8|nr:hypothetical protein [Roseibium sp. Sym1]
MVSVPQRFAGFRSASSVLADPGLSRTQKKAALLSWREALNRQTPASGKEKANRARILKDIGQALVSLEKSGQASDEWKHRSRRRLNTGG